MQETDLWRHPACRMYAGNRFMETSGEDVWHGKISCSRGAEMTEE